MRTLLLAVTAGLFALTSLSVRAGNGDIFVGSSVPEVTLDAPLGELFARAGKNPDYTVTGRLTWKDGTSPSPITLESVGISERGHTSRQASECGFPKLKLDLRKASRDGTPFEHIDTLKVGTHCDDRPDSELTPKYGRLANEHSPVREALVYRVLHIVGVPTLLARPARFTYVFSGDAGRPPLTRMAMLLEDDEEARARVGGSHTLTEETFTSARERFSPADTARVAFAEAMIGNFDWCLRMFPGDIYRCDERHPVWNVLAFERPNATAIPLIYDFDLSGPVVGRHVWFNQVFDDDFVQPPSHVQAEVLAQVQRTRSLFDRAVLDHTRAAFLRARAAVMHGIDDSDVDDTGKRQAHAYIDAFYDAIADNASFYRPVVTSPAHPPFLDVEQTRIACGASSLVPVGTPVSAPIEERGELVRVRLLDALWEWTGAHRCDAVHRDPVWLPRAAIGGDYPR